MRKPFAPFRFERQEMMRLEDMQKAKSDWACQKEKTYSTRQKDTQLACRTIILVGFYSHFAIEGKSLSVAFEHTPGNCYKL